MMIDQLKLGKSLNTKKYFFLISIVLLVSSFAFIIQNYIDPLQLLANSSSNSRSDCTSASSHKKGNILSLQSQTSPPREGSSSIHAHQRSVLIHDYQLGPLDDQGLTWIEISSASHEGREKVAFKWTQAWITLYKDQAFTNATYQISSFPMSTDANTTGSTTPVPTTIFPLDLSKLSVELGSPFWVEIACIVEGHEDEGGAVLEILRLIEPIRPMPIYDDILLVIHFALNKAYPFIDLILSKYGDAFPHKYLVTTDVPEDPTLMAPEGHLHVWEDVKQGWHMHRVMQHAMEEHPGYRGYLMTNSDIMSRWWKWSKLDRDKIWYNSNVHCGPPVGQWGGWRWSEAASSGVFEDLLSKITDEEQKKFAFELCNGNQAMVQSDFFYVPGIYRERYLDIMAKVDDVKLGALFEGLIPLVLSLVDAPHNWIKFRSVDDVGGGDGAKIFLADNEKEELDFVHSWKAGIPEVEGIEMPIVGLGKKIWFQAPAP